MTTDPRATAARQANRALYDTIAPVYEAVDGRRTAALAAYVRDMLVTVRARAPGDSLLDLGCGAGFVAQCAEGVFRHRVGVDLSGRILEVGRRHFEEYRVGDADAIPYPDASFDAVACFAMLHHLADDRQLVREVHRVLRPGGVLYTDHDMDLAFHRRFRWPLAGYRRLFRSPAPYVAVGARVEDYHRAEARGDGIDAEALAAGLTAAGFQVDLARHWYGLNGLTDRCFGRRTFATGWAPLVRVLACRR
jgi:ubiquinone/menaquinone biosynthesis C-methylase UbiE